MVEKKLKCVSEATAVEWLSKATMDAMKVCNICCGTDAFATRGQGSRHALPGRGYVYTRRKTTFNMHILAQVTQQTQ